MAIQYSQVERPLSEPTVTRSWQWHCEPPTWLLDAERARLRIEPESPTDFWQATHYGFRADNGHFWGRQLEGDFELSALVRWLPKHQYDQAGLMIRLSAMCWLKTSVEFEPDQPSRLGAVVTNFGFSDWSTQAFLAATAVWLRVRREANDFLVAWSLDGHVWDQLRVAHLHEARGLAVDAGIYACSPKGTGFSAEFEAIELRSVGFTR